MKDEKEKSKDEKDKRVKATKENKKLNTENKILQDQLKEAKDEWIEMNNKKVELEASWEKEKTKYLNKINEQKKDMSKINQLNATSSQLLQNNIDSLQKTLTNRQTQAENMMADFDKTRKELKETLAQLNDMTGKAEEAEKRLEALGNRRPRPIPYLQMLYMRSQDLAIR